jgi:hypothetical protein
MSTFAFDSYNTVLLRLSRDIFVDVCAGQERQRETKLGGVPTLSVMRLAEVLCNQRKAREGN